MLNIAATHWNNKYRLMYFAVWCYNQLVDCIRLRTSQGAHGATIREILVYNQVPNLQNKMQFHNPREYHLWVFHSSSEADCLFMLKTMKYFDTYTISGTVSGIP